MPKQTYPVYGISANRFIASEFFTFHFQYSIMRTLKKASHISFEYDLKTIHHVQATAAIILPIASAVMEPQKIPLTRKKDIV